MSAVDSDVKTAIRRTRSSLQTAHRDCPRVRPSLADDFCVRAGSATASSTYEHLLAATRPVNERRSVRDRLWRRVEGVIDAFQDTDREVLPENAWRFILYFAKQAKGPFILLLIVGGLAGAVDAGLYWSVGWLIDLLDKANPATLFRDHWPELAALAALLLVVRTAGPDRLGDRRTTDHCSRLLFHGALAGIPARHRTAI